MLPTFVIGLREGLEASLIVGIIAAFLIQRGDRKALRPMWLGVVVAIALCAAVAIVLRVIGESLPFKQREILEGASRPVRGRRRHVHGRLDAPALARPQGPARGPTLDHALLTGSVLALVGMAFFAVLREGLETAIFMLAAFQSSSDPVATGLGAVLGVTVAVALGYAIYRGGVRINLSRFFRLTGFVLVLVAAGLLASGVHSLAEAGVVTALQHPAFDISWLVAPGTIRASLITGMLGLQPVPTVAEVVVWLVYAVPMSLYVLWPQRSRPLRSPAAAPATATSTTAA